MHQLNTFNLDFVTCMFQKNDWVVSIIAENDGKHFVEKVFKFIVFALNESTTSTNFTK